MLHHSHVQSGFDNMAADRPLWHAQKTAKAEEKEEVKIDPVQQALANYSIINVNPWEPEKPCAPAQLHNKLAPRSAAVQDYAS